MSVRDTVSPFVLDQILVAALQFFLGKDEDEKNDSDSDSEVSGKKQIIDALVGPSLHRTSGSDWLCCFIYSDGGTLSSRPEGEILHWQENQQKQEEDGKGHESPCGTSGVTCAQTQLLNFAFVFH